MSTRTTTRLTIITFERIEETTERPSRPVITTTGETVDELPSRPGLRAARALATVTPIRRVG